MAAAPESTDLFCVVDLDPRFDLEAWRWFETATSLASIDTARLHIGHIGPPSHMLAALATKGATLVQVDPFDGRSPHCNKISGARAFLQRTEAENVVLSDADLAWCDNPHGLPLPGDVISAKLVDRPNPPIEVLEEVYLASGLQLPDIATVDLGNGAEFQTTSTNFNGGLYCASAATARVLVEEWDRWARWMLDRLHLLRQWAVHVDQVAMSLAVTALELEVNLLGAKWNYPLHLTPAAVAASEEPSALHYHWHLTSIGLLRESGDPVVDAQVAKVNTVLARSWQQDFSNEAFWEWRYVTNPELGSGVGSRDNALAVKRDLLAALDTAMEPGAVLDIGCGDSVVTTGLFENAVWTGVDLSAEALRLSTERRPSGTFLLGEAGLVADAADLVLCLDVLIHQSDHGKLVAIVETALRLARQAILISGYEAPPTADSPMIHFHEPLSSVLSRLADLDQWELKPVLDTNGAIAVLLLRRDHDRYVPIESNPILRRWLADVSNVSLLGAGQVTA